MKKILFALTALCGLALFSCNKDKDMIDDNNNGRYIKSWAADANGGELDGYVNGFNIQANGTGQFEYKLPANAMGQSPINWAVIAGDSIKVEFTCELFPEYKFELRALANAGATLAPGIYYRIKKSDPADRVYRGTMTLD